MMKKLSYPALSGIVACATLLMVANTTRAAEVAFTADVFDNVTDVSTNGTLVTAVNLGQGDNDVGVNSGTPTTPVVVNGVNFGADSGDGVGFFVVDAGGAVAPGTFKANDGNDFGTAASYDPTVDPIIGLSEADGNALLDSLEFGGGIGNSVARLSGLSIGQAYELQLLIARNNGTTFDFGYATPSGDATEVYTLTGVAVAPPAIVTGTFTADEVVQDIHVALSGNANLEVNAFQLRAIPEPSSLLLLGLGGCLAAALRRSH